MKSFKQRVINLLRSQDWNIQYTDTIPFIDFFSVRPGVHIKNAYRVKAHGHLTHREQDALHEYGRTHNMHVLYAHESDGHEIVFVRLFPRNT